VPGLHEKRGSGWLTRATTLARDADYPTSAQATAGLAAPSELVRRVLEAMAASVTTRTPTVDSAGGPQVDVAGGGSLKRSQLSGPSSLVSRHVDHQDGGQADGRERDDVVSARLPVPVRSGGTDREAALRIAFVGTFPPTQCGLATFTESMVDSISHAGGAVEPVVIRLIQPKEPTGGAARATVDWIAGDAASFHQVRDWAQAFVA
jgi:hypothetical protein